MGARISRPQVPTHKHAYARADAAKQAEKEALASIVDEVSGAGAVLPDDAPSHAPASTDDTSDGVTTPTMPSSHQADVHPRTERGKKKSRREKRNATPTSADEIRAHRRKTKNDSTFTDAATTPTSTLCAQSGCSFYGSAATGGFCSSCFAQTQGTGPKDTPAVSMATGFRPRAAARVTLPPGQTGLVCCGRGLAEHDATAAMRCSACGQWLHLACIDSSTIVLNAEWVCFLCSEDGDDHDATARGSGSSLGRALHHHDSDGDTSDSDADFTMAGRLDDVTNDVIDDVTDDDDGVPPDDSEATLTTEVAELRATPATRAGVHARCGKSRSNPVGALLSEEELWDSDDVAEAATVTSSMSAKGRTRESTRLAMESRDDGDTLRYRERLSRWRHSLESNALALLTEEQEEDARLFKLEQKPWDVWLHIATERKVLFALVCDLGTGQYKKGHGTKKINSSMPLSKPINLWARNFS